MATTFTARTSGTCTACFARYTPGQKVYADSTGKVKHVRCAEAATRAPLRAVRTR